MDKVRNGLPVLSSDQFVWKDGKGSVELSDLRKAVPPMSFLVYSTKTQRYVNFTFVRRETDKEEDYGWWFRSNGLSKAVEILIIND